MPLAEYQQALGEALAAATERGVRRRGVTPFLLERLRAATEGRSVFSNLALLRHNARVAGALAGALARGADEAAGA
jgi:pseudouridine-5'-phosphate glycosidase